MPTELETTHDALRHFLKALVYRFNLITEDAPAGFAEFSAGGEVRRPGDIVRHMTGLMRFAHGEFGELEQEILEPLPWPAECARFTAQVAALDRVLAADKTTGSGRGLTLEQVWQGPLIDAMTHIGQLATLRRLAGSPITGGRYWQVELPPFE